LIKINEDQIEGRNPVWEALRANRPINKIYIKKGEHRGKITAIIDRAKKTGIPMLEIDEDTFLSMAQTPGHQGVLAKAASKNYSSVEDILKRARELNEDPFIIILNELTDPQNFGSILRTADGLGAHGVIIPKHRACGITPAVAKVSSGAVEYVKVARVTNIARTMDELKKEGLWIIGADIDGNCIDYIFHFGFLYSYSNICRSNKCLHASKDSPRIYYNHSNAAYGLSYPSWY
jgi:23S rRNA (guanosine2251-2'-O)-methyltransferase